MCVDDGAPHHVKSILCLCDVAAKFFGQVINTV
jgi:hypothetical protein